MVGKNVGGPERDHGDRAVGEEVELQEMVDRPVPSTHEQGIRSGGPDGCQCLWPFVGATDRDVSSFGECGLKPSLPAKMVWLAPERTGSGVVEKSGPPGPKRGNLRLLEQRQGVPPAWGRDRAFR